MSLILDALNKAQRERQEERQPVPQLSTVHYAPAAFEQSSRSRMLPWLALAVIVVGALLFVILKAVAPPTELPAPSPLAAEPRSPASPVAQARVPGSASVGSVDNGQELTSAAVVPASAQAMSQRRPAPATTSTPTTTSTTTQVNDLYRTASTPVPAKVRPAAQKSANSDESTAAVSLISAATSPEAGTQPSAEQADQQDVAQTAQTQTEQPAAQTAAEPAPAPEASLDDHPDIPRVDELSWSTQQMLPSILYTVHHYEANPANRLVEINSTTFRTGGTVAEGLILEEILNDGIILRYRSQRFKLPALNSWVNF